LRNLKVPNDEHELSENRSIIEEVIVIS